MQWKTCALFGICLLAATAAAQSPMPTLDLTKPLSCVNDRMFGGGSGGGVGYEGEPPPPRLPLVMRLVQVEPKPVKWLHKLIFEVELENAGAAPFRIPWATECDVNVDDPDLVTVDVSLMPVGYPDSDQISVRGCLWQQEGY